MNNKYYIELDTKRRAFKRGEIAELVFNIKGFNQTFLSDSVLEFKIGEWENCIEIPELRFFHQNLKIELDTKLLKSGSYKLDVVLRNSNNILAEAVFDIMIAAGFAHDRFIFWHWPATAFYNALEADEEVGKRELKKLAELGFTHAQLRADWAVEHPEKAGRLIDYALTLGIELGGLVPNYNKGPFSMDGLPEDAALVTDFSPSGKVANPHYPEVMKRNRRWMESMMNVLKPFPSCSTIFMNSELEDKLAISDDPESIKLHEKNLGFSLDKVKRRQRVFTESADDADYLRPGVIADDDPEFVYSKYYFKHGDGWTPTNRLMADVVHEYRPDINVIADPLRLCSLYGRFDGVDTVSSWTYSTPDPKAMLFNETLRCEAEPDDKKIIQTITMYNYGGSVAVSDADRKSLQNVLCMGPGRYLESAWLNISRVPEGIGIYFSSQLEPAIEDVDDFVRPRKTFDAIKEFSEQVLLPFGGVFRKLKTAPRKVAVLDSWASRVYGVCPRPYSHYQNYFIYNFYTLLNMAHIPADVIFEETVLDKGLDGYDMLVLPCCDTFPESVYEKICEFEKKGGKIVADQWLRADIPNVIRFDFDFSYRKNVNANAINKGIQFASNEDTVFKTDWKRQKARGVTAEEDRDTMEAYCKQLRNVLNENFEREVDCDTPRVLMNRLDCGKTKYLVLVNDNRAYDERIGKYKAMLGKGMPQSAVVTWKGIGKNEVLYDLISGTRLDCTHLASGEVSFEIELPASGGALVMVAPEELGKPEVACPVCINERGRLEYFKVSVSKAGGATPLRVEIIDPAGEKSDFSGCFTAVDGVAEIPFAGALNDLRGKWRISVTSLADNSVAEAEFNLE
jgi:hypothetical protein